MLRLTNGFLVAVSVLFAAVLAEGATRFIDGLPLFTDWLPNTVDRDTASKHVDAIPRAPGVARAWFFADPPPLPNRTEPPAAWSRWAREIGDAPQTTDAAYRPADAFKAWNTKYLGNPCDSAIFRQAPGRLYVYDPHDGSPHPRYRYLPNATTPLGLTTNQIGWRGPPIETRHARRLIRIVFVGASTTVNSHYYPYSYPELVGHWLNLWARSRKLDVDFEALNAGREAIDSTDIESIVRNEVLPLGPALVVYYEGHNQFDMARSLKRPLSRELGHFHEAAPESSMSRWLRAASHRLALARRLQSALVMADNSGRGGEWPKPEYELPWPDDEADPDLSRADLPVNLSVILRDLERMRIVLEKAGAELAVSSFIWMVKDGMVVDPVDHKLLLEWLNITKFPFRYKDIERMVAFENRVFAKYAATRGLPFFDVAALLPQDPDLFTDAIHMTYAGIRLHAWIVLNGLVPLIEQRIAGAAWPRPQQSTAEIPSSLLFAPRELTFHCPQLPATSLQPTPPAQ